MGTGIVPWREVSVTTLDVSGVTAANSLVNRSVTLPRNDRPMSSLPMKSPDSARRIRRSRPSVVVGSDLARIDV